MNIKLADVKKCFPTEATNKQIIKIFRCKDKILSPRERLVYSRLFCRWGKGITRVKLGQDVGITKRVRIAQIIAKLKALGLLKEEGGKILVNKTRREDIFFYTEKPIAEKFDEQHIEKKECWFNDYNWAVLRINHDIIDGLIEVDDAVHDLHARQKHTAYYLAKRFGCDKKTIGKARIRISDETIDRRRLTGSNRPVRKPVTKPITTEGQKMPTEQHFHFEIHSSEDAKLASQITKDLMQTGHDQASQKQKAMLQAREAAKKKNTEIGINRIAKMITD